MICSGLCLIHFGSQQGCPRAAHPDNCCRGSGDQTSGSQWISFSPYFLNNRTREGKRMRERGNSKVLRWHLLPALSLPAVLKNPPHHTMHWPLSFYPFPFCQAGPTVINRHIWNTHTTCRQRNLDTQHAHCECM